MGPKSITITLVPDKDNEYVNDVSELVIGSMVDPVTGKSWLPPIGEKSWKWKNEGGNVNVFGLMGNNYYSGNNSGEKTAFSKMVIDPTKMPDDKHVEVVATLLTAYIEDDPNNPILRFSSVTVDKATNKSQAYINEWGTAKPQPPSTFANK